MFSCQVYDEQVGLTPEPFYAFPRYMRLKIVQIGEAVLRQQAKALTADEIRSRETQQLIEWMRETMHDAPGVGLAAPQIGLALQLAVIEDKPENLKDAPAEFLKERERKPVPFHVLINPKITLDGAADVEFFEGCLSFAGYTAMVPRARKVKVRLSRPQGKHQNDRRLRLVRENSTA